MPSVTVTPQTIATLRAAESLYLKIAEGKIKVYDTVKYRFYDPDGAMMLDKAKELRRLMKEIQP